MSKKSKQLEKRLKKMGKVAIAFSGGVDSAFLISAAVKALGAENVLAVIVDSQFVSRDEIENAISYCVAEEVPYKIARMDALASFQNNPPNRCYLCKLGIFKLVKQEATKAGIETVLEGSNLDDVSDYRPGMKAIEELDIKSPLLDAKLTKKEIRELSHEMDLVTWDKPSSPCLATRFVFGEPITQERLNMVDAAEKYLLDSGFEQVRVRTHGDGENTLARIEVGEEDFPKLDDPAMRKSVSEKLKKLGYAYVAFDALGYRRGSMNVKLPLTREEISSRMSGTQF